MKKRKILSLLLSLCLLIGLLPTAALAADQTNAGAGIRIQYVDGSYDKTTGIMKVRVQAKMPAGTGITCIGILMSWDNTKLSLVSQYDSTYDYAPADDKSEDPASDAMKTIMATKKKSGPPVPGAYTVTDGKVYTKDARTALYTFHANTDPLTYVGTDAQTSGNWFDVYEVMFRVAGKPTDPATVLNSDSLRIADVAKGDDAVMKGAFPANDIYSIYLTDNSDPAKLYVLNRMSGCTATEVTGEKSLMTAPDTGTATYPGSDNAPSTSTTYKVSFDANGGTGTMADVTGVTGSYTLPANGFTAPSGKQFKGWATSASGTVITGTSITVSADTTLYAIWEPIPVTTYTVSFDANGGTGTMADVTGVTGNYTLPANGFTAPSGKQFKGWATSASGTVITGTSITVSADTKLYAIWEPIPVTEYTITFNVNGGNGTIPPQTTSGQKLSSLPTATHSGSYSFDGWYTAASGGTQITTAYVFSANTTVYAHWTYTGGSVGVGSYTPSYTVSVDKTENGTITVSPKSASKGSIVTITVKPDKGYTLETLRALDMSGYAMELTENNGRFTFKMPASAVIVKATFMDDNTMLNFFVDVKASDYFYDAVLWAAEKGVTSGADALHFSPNAPCTRAQIVTFLWRAAGSPAPKNMSSFADVPADAFYAKAVAWAVENGITGGTGDGKFSPDATCTRAQAVTFLYRASGAPAVSGNAAFSDVAANAYYAAAVKWAEKNGITDGIGGGLFGSNNNCTRAQIVTFLYRSVK